MRAIARPPTGAQRAAGGRPRRWGHRIYVSRLCVLLHGFRRARNVRWTVALDRCPIGFLLPFEEVVASQPIVEFRNIGSKSARMLEQIGVSMIDQLHELGSVNAYLKLQFSYPYKISLNFLWAMHAVLQDRDWRDPGKQENPDIKSQLIEVNGNYF